MLAALGIGGYFIYKHFETKKSLEKNAEEWKLKQASESLTSKKK